MIRHILADGREVESVEGMVIPRTGTTAAVYRVVEGFVRSRQEATRSKEEADAQQGISTYH